MKTSAKRKSYQYERILNKTHHCRLYYKNGISTVIYETMYWLGYKKTGKHETDTGVENLAMRLWKSFRMQRRDDISYYDTMGEFEAERFAVNLNQLIAEEMVEKQKAGVIFLCIGTDRSTGDSLGPLVGHKLRKCRLKKAAVIGTLDKPVHAMNLELYAAYIHTHFSDHVVVAIDAKKRANGEGWTIYKHGGRIDTGIDAVEWAKRVCDLGAGEILLTSMDCDGTKAGYDIELTRAVAEAVSVPVIASGGAGTMTHFYDALTEGKADAALAASLFHYKELEIRDLKEYLASRSVSVRL